MTTRYNYDTVNRISEKLNFKKVTEVQNKQNSNLTVKKLNDTSAAQLWHKIDWKEVNKKVAELQEAILKAYQTEKMATVYKLQRKLILSFEGRAKAVRKVVTNSGGKTPGIDNEKVNCPAQYFDKIKWLKTVVESPKNYKASPLKRVYIPKPGKKELRGLGIPTINDRIVQAIYHMAIDPVVEEKSDINSFGFRKERSTHDAIIYFKNYMDKHYAPRWVLEADIKKCFDRISHYFLMENTPICDKQVLEQWLKSGVINEGSFENTEEGTPQGGIISPTLCNIALNGLEETIKNSVKWEKKVSPGIKIIRYADDIVITGKSRETLEIILPKLKEFLTIRGLTLSEEKTKITPIEQGIDLLGFNIRRQKWHWKYNDKNAQKDVLIVKPSQKGIINIKSKIKQTIKNSNKMEEVVGKLNPILRGWAEHKRITPHARKAFFLVDNYVWEMLRSKFIRSKPGQRVVDDNYKKIYKGRGRWGDKNGILILNLARVGSKQLRMKQLNWNPYLIENQEYFAKHRQTQLLTNLKQKLFKKYKDTCPVCQETLNNGEIIEIHHKTPENKKGSNKLTNLEPVHRICHMKRSHEKN